MSFQKVVVHQQWVFHRKYFHNSDIIWVSRRLKSQAQWANNGEKIYMSSRHNMWQHHKLYSQGPSSGMCYHSLHWRHNDHDGVSNHHPHGCLLNRLFRRRSKKTSKLRVTGLYAGNSPGPVNSPHKEPVVRKMFPFGDVIMYPIFSNRYHKSTLVVYS